jgi:hypothetical protein
MDAATLIATMPDGSTITLRKSDGHYGATVSLPPGYCFTRTRTRHVETWHHEGKGPAVTFSAWMGAPDAWRQLTTDEMEPVGFSLMDREDYEATL